MTHEDQDRQLEELDKATREAAEAVTRAKRAVWSLLIGDGKTPWEDAFEPDEQPEPPEYRHWPKWRGPQK